MPAPIKVATALFPRAGFLPQFVHPRVYTIASLTDATLPPNIEMSASIGGNSVLKKVIAPNASMVTAFEPPTNKKRWCSSEAFRSFPAKLSGEIICGGEKTRGVSDGCVPPVGDAMVVKQTRVCSIPHTCMHTCCMVRTLDHIFSVQCIRFFYFSKTYNSLFALLLHFEICDRLPS